MARSGNWHSLQSAARARWTVGGPQTSPARPAASCGRQKGSVRARPSLASAGDARGPLAAALGGGCPARSPTPSRCCIVALAGAVSASSASGSETARDTAVRCARPRSSASKMASPSKMRRKQGTTYYCEGPCGVFTVTGRPRNEPWRPYGRIVSPERALQPLSVDPWRETVSFRVIITSGVHGKTRTSAGGRWESRGLLAQRNLRRLLHRARTRDRCAHGGAVTAVAERMRRAAIRSGGECGAE
jgi:hypothetical protein